MLLGQATFGKARSELDAEDTADKVDGYLAMLQKNGQICGDALRAVSNGDVVAYAYLTRPDSTSRKHHSRYGIKELDVLSALFGQPPSWKLLADDVPATFPDLHDSSALCLFTSAFDGESPICCIDTGERFPAYIVPIDDDERERMFFWSREYNRMDGIWFSSGELEIPAYEQMASPSSLLSKQGRELASQVESSLDIPVYYFLMRYYGRGEHETERRCPGCGKDWRYRTDNSKGNSFWSFPFRCAECRLVSQHADAAYDSSYAHIGEFQPNSSGIATETDEREPD
jgi:predicted  nucleic acid-binding Zn ribbon protein